MRVTDVYVDGYGIHHHLQLTAKDFATPIILICGPNEAGKSTLHSFIRSMLFGFHLKGVSTYEALQGGQLGGTITLLNQQGETIQIVRKKPPKQGKVSVLVNQERIEGEDYLKKEMGYLSPDLYSHLFAFNLHQLQRIETLQQEEISSYLYGAATGTGFVNLVDIEKKLERKKEQLFKPRAINPELNQLVRELEERQEAIDQLKKKMEQYTPLKERQAILQKEIEALRLRRELIDQDKKSVDRRHKVIEITKELEQLSILIATFLPSSPIHLFQLELHSLLLERKLMKEKNSELESITKEIQQGEHRLQEVLQSIGEHENGSGGTSWRSVDLSIPSQDELFGLAEKKKALEELHSPLTKLRGSQTNSSQSTSLQKKKRVFLMLSPVILLGFPTSLLYMGYVWPGVFLFIGILWIVLQQFNNIHVEEKLLKEELAIEEKHKAFQQEWSIEMEKRGIPSSLSADRLPTYLRCIEKAQQYAYELEQMKEKQQGIQYKLAEWKSSILQVAAKMELNGVGRDPFLLLDTLLLRLEKEEEEQQKRKDAEHKQRELQLQLEQLMNEPSWDLEGQKVVESKFETGLRSRVEPGQELNDVEPGQEQNDAEQLLVTKQQLEDEYVEVLNLIEEKATQIGQVRSELKELESEGTLSLLQQEFYERKATFQKRAREWSVFALAQYASQYTRRIFEEERQPSLLKEASKFIKKITLGRYTQVLIPFGAKELLLVRRDGERLLPHQLSQGTVEQLYLSMRFAFIKEYGHTVRLPVLMDDIFVNFDSTRLTEALEGVKELSRTNQIIIFTCHQYMVDEIRNISPETQPIFL